MRKKEEHFIQVTMVNKLRNAGFLVFAVPNGGARNKITASNLKREGVLAGVSDLVIVLKENVVFIEVKTEKGIISKSQKEFGEWVNKLGHEWQVWRSMKEVQKFIDDNRYFGK